jgi:hypothetical protein
VTIPDAEQDKDLPAKLQAELPRILRWAVEGCLEWQRGGLLEPDEVKSSLSTGSPHLPSGYLLAAYATPEPSTTVAANSARRSLFM